MTRKGFTLAEIMVAAAIIAIIIAIALPSFIRGSRTAQANTCIANLRVIDKAKSLWALKEDRAASDIPVWDDLVTAYIKKTPVCPAGGTYFIGSVRTKPACTIAGHVLP